ncbi:hypothetical protein VISP3789_19838 [Vibrio splendidus ATCC 33789]|nr:hypothetical protein VISP3789_19838 [Vibrio splendidus ATCC 33789]
MPAANVIHAYVLLWWRGAAMHGNKRESQTGGKVTQKGTRG